MSPQHTALGHNNHAKTLQNAHSVDLQIGSAKDSLVHITNTSGTLSLLQVAAPSLLCLICSNGLLAAAAGQCYTTGDSTADG